ncbi:hypothetical protein WMF04_28705 [Sorangium sp. So ce260]|uniref:hypothetical protein n=1 Tax=Sorangium sp. So ce260 TaxID=3133291 RepID=UPI003F62CB95
MPAITEQIPDHLWVGASLPDDLRPPPPRGAAARRHAKPQRDTLLVWLLVLLAINPVGLIAAKFIWSGAAGVSLFSSVIMLLLVASAALDYSLALKLARHGVAVAAEITHRRVTIRGSQYSVWAVRTETGATANITWGGPLVPGMVVLELPDRRLGVFYPGPHARGIHTSRTI